LTLKEYDLQRIICSKCHHIQISETKVIKSITPENFHCENCWTGDNVHRSGHLVVCSSCQQVWHSRKTFLHIKGCEVVKPYLFKIQYDPEGKWMKDKQLEKKTRDAEINLAKSNRILRARVEAEKWEPVQRQVRVEELLKENNKIQSEIRDVLVRGKACV